MVKFDKKTLALIKKLKVRNDQGKLNEVDKI
jgi:hypothetical protein